MKRIGFLAYGLISYLAMLLAILSAIGFVGNFGVTDTLDQLPSTNFFAAVLINGSLVATIVLMYVVAKSGNLHIRIFQRIPSPVKQSTRVLLTALVCILFVQRWEPVGVMVWSIDDSVIQAVLRIFYLSGWSVIFISTFLINHFDVFGLRQVWYYYRGKNYTRKPSLAPGHEQLVRHPFYIGFLFVCWSAPIMTIAHLSLAVAVTAYVLFAIHQGRKTPVYRHHHTY